MKPIAPSAFQLSSVVPLTNRLRHGLLVVCLAVVAGASVAVHAQNAPYDRVERLLNAGELTLALNEAEAWLSQQPRDPQMRFLQGVIQKQQGDLASARATFTQLTREFPELPEPHNNLAVLDAAEGRLHDALRSLETAIRLNPAYGTAHRNLGDVYLRLAADAYRTALLQSGGTDLAVQHLQSIERLMAAPSR